MPDFDLDAVRNRQAAARADAATELDDTGTAHLEHRAVAACRLCDEHGYTRAHRVCDHTDHATATARGRGLVRAELEKIRKRKTDTRGGAA